MSRAPALPIEPTLTKPPTPTSHGCGKRVSTLRARSLPAISTADASIRAFAASAIIPGVRKGPSLKRPLHRLCWLQHMITRSFVRYNVSSSTLTAARSTSSCSVVPKPQAGAVGLPLTDASQSPKASRLPHGLRCEPESRAGQHLARRAFRCSHCQASSTNSSSPKIPMPKVVPQRHVRSSLTRVPDWPSGACRHRAAPTA